MPDLIAVATPFITILFLLLVGAGLRRWGLVTQEGARQMTGLVLNVTLPPLIFVTLATEITPQELGRTPLLVAMGVIGTLIGYGVSGIVGRLPLFSPERRSTLQAVVALTNTTFIGYPVCKALLGSRGLLYAVLYDVGLTVVMSTLSIWLLSRGSKRGGWGDLLRSPMMWSVVWGLIWGALGWPMPGWLIQPLRTLGRATTPLALLTVGMLVQPVQAGASVPVSQRRGSSEMRWPSVVLAVARLVVTPALIWGLVLLLKVERSAAAVIVLQTAMPAAVATTAMAEQYGGDSAFAAAGVVTTTLLSLLTLPVWSGILR